MYARGKPCRISKHANEGMRDERPPIGGFDVVGVLEEPTSDDGRVATRRVRRRTILVYYKEYDDGIYVRGVSATRSRLST